MEASNKRQTSLKIKRLVYIAKKGVNPFGLTPLSSGFRLSQDGGYLLFHCYAVPSA